MTKRDFTALAKALKHSIGHLRKVSPTDSGIKLIKPLDNKDIDKILDDMIDNLSTDDTKIVLIDIEKTDE